MPKRLLWLLLAVALPEQILARSPALATPSTTFWAPSTPALQPYGLLHITYDTYFQPRAAYAIDLGLEVGVLPTKRLQLELGFDLLYPTTSTGGKLDSPVLLNIKIGAPEEAYFAGSPGWSAGIFGVGFERNVSDYNVLHVMLGKTLPRIGSLSAGAYYGLNERLLQSSSGEDRRAGIMAGWLSPPFHVARLERVHLAWDILSGENVLGATGGGLCLYFTPSIDLLIGPVYFFDEDLQPGRSRWMWSVQFDADLDLKPLRRGPE